jgi:hypothetical protein
MDDTKKLKKCIIICNGPSVNKIKITKPEFDEYDIIGVNRWKNVFNTLNIPDPDVVLIGKNSYEYNIPFIKKYKETEFVGLYDYKENFDNYKRHKFGVVKCYNKQVNFISSLWWTGIYAIQYALQKEYEEIHVYGFTCTNENDFNDNFTRAGLPQNKVVLIKEFFNKIKEKKLLKYITFHEDKSNSFLKFMLK